MGGALRAHVRWLVHALGSSRNPLLRGQDRLVAVLFLATMVAAALAVPIAATWGNLAYEQGRRAAVEEARSRHQVEAVVTGTPRPVYQGAEPAMLSSQTVTAVTWRGADGRPRSGEVEVDPARGSGGTIVVWVDAADRITAAPDTVARVEGAAVLSAVAALVVMQAVLVTSMVLIRFAVDAHAEAQWEREWAAVEPEWSRERYW